MRPADTPPDDGPDASRTLQERAAAIRAHAHDILDRVHTWQASPNWQPTDTNQRRYRLTVEAIAALHALPDPKTPEDLAVLIDAVRPILTEWRPSRPGSEQAIYAAVERLQDIASP